MIKLEPEYSSEVKRSRIHTFQLENLSFWEINNELNTNIIVQSNNSDVLYGTVQKFRVSD